MMASWCDMMIKHDKLLFYFILIPLNVVFPIVECESSHPEGSKNWFSAWQMGPVAAEPLWRLGDDGRGHSARQCLPPQVQSVRRVEDSVLWCRFLALPKSTNCAKQIWKNLQIIGKLCYIRTFGLFIFFFWSVVWISKGFSKVFQDVDPCLP